jgi:HEPN domain-containing protein
VREATRLLLETADRDLEASEGLAGVRLYARASFFLQQAAEKSLKALLAEHGEREIVHSGLRLCTILAEQGMDIPEELRDDVRRLDRCYIDTRYPNGIGLEPEMLFDEKQMTELRECCLRVMAFVKSHLS